MNDNSLARARCIDLGAVVTNRPNATPCGYKDSRGVVCSKPRTFYPQFRAEGNACIDHEEAVRIRSRKEQAARTKAKKDIQAARAAARETARHGLARTQGGAA